MSEKAFLFLFVGENAKRKSYRVEKVNSGDISVAWKLHQAKEKDGPYMIVAHPTHVECECADFLFRKHECRHIKALRDVGLINGAKP